MHAGRGHVEQGGEVSSLQKLDFSGEERNSARKLILESKSNTSEGYNRAQTEDGRLRRSSVKSSHWGRL